MTINQFEIQVTPPERTNVAWYNPQTNEFRFFVNGEWKLPSDFSQSGDGENSIVQKGSNAVAFGINSTAFGTSTTNAKERGITEESTDEEILEEWENSDPESDKFALAKGEGALVEGNNCLALGKNSHAEGNGTIAANNSSHAEGTGTQAVGKYSHAEGLETLADGERAHAEGQEARATGKNTHAEGQGTLASGKNAHAEGRMDKVLNPIDSFNDSIKSAATESKMYQTLSGEPAESLYTVGDRLWKISTNGEDWTDVFNQEITVTDVYGNGSAWFKLSKKLNIGNKATRYITILTDWEEAYPTNCGALGACSHSEGVNTIATNEGEHAEGKWNKSNSGESAGRKTVHSVGIGTGNRDRRNAIEIMQDGDIYLFDVGGYDGTNPAEATPINELIGRDLPLQITGTYSNSDNEFTCTSGHSVADVKDALLAGTRVIVDVTDSDNFRYVTTDISVVQDSGSWYAISHTFTSGIIDSWVVQS